MMTLFTDINDIISHRCLWEAFKRGVKQEGGSPLTELEITQSVPTNIVG